MVLDGITQKQRTKYIRPFVLFWLSSLIAELFFLTVAVLCFSGFRDMIHKVIWTLVLCPLGMGGALGGLTDYFLVDYYNGKRAAQFTAILSLLVLGSCNYLCFSLDHYFGYFGATTHPLWFHLRYPVIYYSGYSSGKLLFTEEGQKKLEKLGI